MSNCAEEDIYCDLPYDHPGPCVELDIHELIDPITTVPVKSGNTIIGEAMYIGKDLIELSIDDKFAKRFMTDSINNLSIYVPKN